MGKKFRADDATEGEVDRDREAYDANAENAAARESKATTFFMSSSGTWVTGFAEVPALPAQQKLVKGKQGWLEIQKTVCFMRRRRSRLRNSSFTTNNYLESCDQTPGSTGVPSAFTAVRADGFNPKASTMVGATCVVAVSAKTVCGLKHG